MTNCCPQNRLDCIDKSSLGERCASNLNHCSFSGDSFATSVLKKDCNGEINKKICCASNMIPAHLDAQSVERVFGDQPTMQQI